MALTTDIFSKIKKILTEAELRLDAIEYTEALSYLQGLLKDIPENTAPTTEQLQALEPKLVRFFRIRPSQFNAIASPVTDVHHLLKNKYLLETPLTTEEVLTANVLTFIFKTHRAPEMQSLRSHKTYQETVKLSLSTDNLYEKASKPETSIQLLQKKAPNFNWDITEIDDFTPLHNAVKEGAATFVKQLLDVGANPNAKSMITGSTPLIYAVENAQVEVVSVLCGNEKVDVNLSTRIGKTPLDIAINIQNFPIIKILAEHKNIQLAKHEKTLAILAAERGWLEVLKAAITSIPTEKRASWLNTYDMFGWNPLMKAVYNGHENIVNFLLESGANPNLKNPIGNNTLSFVTSRKTEEIEDSHINIVKTLLKKMNPDLVNAKNEKNLTALEWAMRRKNETLVALLVQFEGITLPDDIANTAKENCWTTVTAALEAHSKQGIAELRQLILEQGNRINTLEKIVDELKAQVAQLSKNNQTSAMNLYRPSTPPPSSPKQTGIDGPKQ